MAARHAGSVARIARRQDDALADHKIARAQDRRQPDRKAEADQTVDPVGAKLLGPGPRPERAAAADISDNPVLQRGAEAAGLGLQAHDHAEPDHDARNQALPARPVEARAAAC